MKPSEMLREAKCELFERGHTKNALVDASGAVCARGAIYVADHGTPLMFGYRDSWTINKVDRILALAAGVVADDYNSSVVPGYNNAPERTFDEIIDWFDKAEKLAEAAEVDA